MPPSDVTVSTSRSVSVSATERSAATSFSTPVDVSAWTTASARAPVFAARASSSACGSIGVPQSASTRTTSAPARRATSHMRSPNTPLTPTITVSPRSTRLTKHVSIPAEPVPEIGSVSGLAVSKTVRRRSHVSPRIRRNSGSRWPSSGCANAAVTSAYGFDGPGPMSNRSGITMPATYARSCGGALRDAGREGELALEVGDRLGGVGHHGACEQRRLAGDAGHDGLRDLDVGRRHREPHGGDGFVRGPRRDPGPAAEAQRLVDPHEVLPGHDLVGRGLVGRVDGTRDGVEILRTEPAQHLHEGLQLHTNETAARAAELRPSWVRTGSYRTVISRTSPSRMSDSLVSSSSNPSVRSTVTRMTAPPTITSTRPG